MSVDMNKIKKHPGFMPFGTANVKVGGETQNNKESKVDSEDKAKDQQKA